MANSWYQFVRFLHMYYRFCRGCWTNPTSDSLPQLQKWKQQYLSNVAKLTENCFTFIFATLKILRGNLPYLAKVRYFGPGGYGTPPPPQTVAQGERTLVAASQKSLDWSCQVFLFHGNLRGPGVFPQCHVSPSKNRALINLIRSY